jgi:hypothetical protein
MVPGHKGATASLNCRSRNGIPTRLGRKSPKVEFRGSDFEKILCTNVGGRNRSRLQLDPRSSPPQVGHVNTGLQETSSCVLTALKKMEGSTITNSVNIVENGKVQEIIGTSDAYQLYLIRLTAESDDTKVEVFNVLNWSDFKVSKFKDALSPCVSGLKIQLRARGGRGKSQRKSGAFTGE